MSIQRLSNSGQSGYRYKTLIAGITPVASVPVIGEATALTFSTASVTFTAPGAYGATTFTATSSPGGITGTSASSPITVSGLSENTAYTFTVTATNASGTSSPSAASNSITTPDTWVPESGYDALATVTVPSGGLASITFAGIPSGYKHLQVRGIVRQNTGGGLSNGYVTTRFNSDSGSNYAYHQLDGNGSGAFSDGGASVTSALAIITLGSSALASAYSPFICDILDYASTNKNKTVRALAGAEQNYANASGDIYFNSALWMNTNAITSIQFTHTNSFAQYSQFALYGIK